MQKHSNRVKSRQQSARMAYCGLMVALSVVLMLSGGMISIAAYCIPMMASILLLPVLLEYGRKTTWITYAATACIVLLLGIDKEAAFFYLFFGYYPILKWEIDRIPRRWLRLPLKLLLYNISFAALYALLGLFLNMEAVLAEFRQMGSMMFVAFLLLFNVCMLLFDRLLTPLVILYVKKLRPRLRFLRN